MDDLVGMNRWELFLELSDITYINTDVGVQSFLTLLFHWQHSNETIVICASEM